MIKINKSKKQPIVLLKQLFKLIFIPIVVVTLSIMILLPLFSSIFLYLEASNQATYISKSLESSYEKLVNHPTTLAFDKFYEKYLNNELSNSEIYQLLYQIQNSSDFKPYFYIASEKGELKFESFLTNQPVGSYLNIVNFRLMNELGASFQPLFSTDINQNGIMIGRSLISEEKTIGYLLFYLSSTHFEDTLGLNNNQQLIITNSLDRIYYSNLPTLDHFQHLKLNNIFLNLSSLNKKAYITFSSSLEDLNLKVISLKSLDFIPQILLGLFFAFLFSLLTTGIVYYKMHRQYMKEGLQVLNDLFSSLSDYEKTGELKLISGSSTYLMSPLNQYNSLLKRIEILLENNQKILSMSANVEMKQLQAQFNPHFLYNTLASIQALIKKDAASANEMILLLGKMLRYAITEEKQHKILLSDDLAYLSDYLKLQKLRFGEYLNYEIHTCCYDYLIPKLIIQPIIENSIIHGYDGINALTIKVFIYEIDDDLYIMVYDNGQGIDEKQLAELQVLINQRELTNRYVGLHNSVRRLQLLYGSESGIIVDSIINEGTIVLIKLKVEKGSYV